MYRESRGAVFFSTNVVETVREFLIICMLYVKFGKFDHEKTVVTLDSFSEKVSSISTMFSRAIFKTSNPHYDRNPVTGGGNRTHVGTKEPSYDVGSMPTAGKRTAITPP